MDWVQACITLDLHLTGLIAALRMQLLSALSSAFGHHAG